MSQQLPESITLDLDAIERPAEERVEPFRVNVKGRVITMTDPSEIDWQDLLFMETPTEFLRFCVADEDREYLYDQKIEGWRFGYLMEQYQKHYKITEKLEKARRDQQRGQRGL